LSESISVGETILTQNGDHIKVVWWNKYFFLESNYKRL
jgi:hypothetical protein